ncbi:MAG: hypothetical protein MJ198_09705 [Bacteroidales bacterium]|nr:hypothetical protein [Bacteroidales bacterium]
MKNVYSFILFIVLSTLFSACNESDKQSENTETEETSATVETSTKNLVGMINGTIYSVPSPYEIMEHVQDLNLQYNQNLPNTVANLNLYESNFKKLLNMGIYGIDVSYMSLYDQVSEALNYFAAIKSLANQIELSTIFDATTMERLEDNMGNLDSLLTILTSKYQESDKLLKGENQTSEAALIMTGCWIESLYLLTQIEKMKDNPTTIHKIAEHKFAAESILNILRPYYEKSNDFKELINDIVDLCYEYDGIDYEYTYKAPTTIAEKHLTIINSESELAILPEHISHITNKIESIRNKIIK